MGSRIELHSILEGILGTSSVYFQPPSSIEMVYPCIVYHRSDIDIKFANNNPYKFKKQYQIKLIYMNPDSDLPDKLASLPTCSFDRRYTSENLYHDIFIIYF